jgi:LDH2 family malate/lactate/ureidoglycolate dehydrogenase
VRDIIAKEGKEVLYQANRGNHFVHGAERLEEAVRYLMTGKVWKGPHSV